MSPIPRNSSWQLLNDAQVIRNPTPIFIPRNGSQPRIICVVKPVDNVRLGLQHHNREFTQMGVSSSNGMPSLLHQQSETKISISQSVDTVTLTNNLCTTLKGDSKTQSSAGPNVVFRGENSLIQRKTVEPNYIDVPKGIGLVNKELDLDGSHSDKDLVVERGSSKSNNNESLKGK
uniref:Uncharacterized protein n=1 Tax=Daphnia galeata TaxID=27404 RepID=A0A8J2RMQ4_9CRUS|nr:unnamed protein product [Daphnia galeata]